MFWTVITVLVVLWLLGFIGRVGGGLIHLVLVSAVVAVLLDLMSRRRNST